MTTFLKTSNATILKRKPIQAAELPGAEKQPIEAGKVLEVQSYLPERDHIKVAFAKDFFKGYNTWYVYAPHVQILKDNQLVLPRPKPKTIKLAIPYKSQRDNEENPDGSCNVTSLAMCMEFLGTKRKVGYGQFEDELYAYAENNGLSRHDPHDLAVIVEKYGCRDDFRPNATIEQAQYWLAAGKPVVIHGYFTSFGHIVVLVGFDEKGFFVHDPYGEWTPAGYNRNIPGISNEKGKYIHYSYNLIRSLCIPDGSFWVHFISKK
ncbi:MAG: C39 family peptidase [Cyanobacteria bacterium CRU_2_1]|nr:C39 family peptidase [Cyanobacteria bacterium RU_5_0]NJR61700.1 C39 family peptidase [Cyanobacteria bacterium CRU_2_1]